MIPDRVDDATLVAIRSALIDWYRHNKRDLPMRSRGVTPWGTLVGEVMSQQTPMPRVQPVWQRWMRLWPTPADLAAAPASRVLIVWGRLGYPSRALRLRECAAAIAARPGGEVPADYDELLALPGIGPYTASAVVSFQFHGRVPVLDTNIRRVLARALVGEERPRSSAPTAFERALATRMLPDEGTECAQWNVAVMEFGALACTQREPQCADCPIATACAWNLAGRPASGHPARTQAWAGTDRQARGRVMALLRSNHEDAEAASQRGVTRDEALTAATLEGAEGDQAERVLAALERDGLLVDEGGVVRLPD